MKSFGPVLFVALTAASLHSSLHAATVTIAGDPNAATSNFGAPGMTATTGYTITTSDDGTNFYTTLRNYTPNGNSFANLYFDSIASTPNTGSNVGFEVTNDRAFVPGGSGYYDLTGTGFSETDTIDTVNNIETIMAIIPNSFFLNDPLGIGFAKTPNGTLVSLHLSQSFGYSVVGGSANFPAPTELGAATVGGASPVPEPATIEYMALSSIGILGALGRRWKSRRSF